MNSKKNKTSEGFLYFMGIGGTGMAATAGLFQEMGFKVCGSDKGIYPPMSTMLDSLKIPVFIPYSEENLKKNPVDEVVVGNAQSRGHPELEYALSNNFKITSFPQLLGERILKDRFSIVVAGTHGKTTTSSLLVHCLKVLGHDVGYLIGGIPKGESRGFNLGSSPIFITEGDEYDTAYFDKGPKFLHYEPDMVLMNNLEFDHADIFANIEEIEILFVKLSSLVSNPANIIAFSEQVGISNLLSKIPNSIEITQTGLRSSNADAVVTLKNCQTSDVSTQGILQKATFLTKEWGELEILTTLLGQHNLANIAQVLGALSRLAGDKKLSTPSLRDPKLVASSIASFAGVKRRLDLLASGKGVDIFEDFAHHPTAIKEVIGGLRAALPQRRLVIAFEPVNATGRRNILLPDFAKALSTADRVLLGPSPVDTRIPEDERMDTKNLAQKINQIKNQAAQAFTSNEDLLEQALSEAKTGDIFVFMSPGGFSGIQHQMANKYSDQRT